MKWLKEHTIEVAVFVGQVLGLIIATSIAWGVLSTRVEANTQAIVEIKDDAKLNRADIVEMKGDIKVLLDRTAKK